MNKKYFCSNCSFFEFIELIDKRYPILKRGQCNYLNKEVDNRWEHNCDYFIDLTINCIQCKHCYDNEWYCIEEDDEDISIDGKENYPYVCEEINEYVDETTHICKKFKER